MGFRDVEPEQPREPQPAVPALWLGVGTVLLGLIAVLPVVVPLVVVMLHTGPRSDAGEPRVFHHSELEPKKRVYPEYPEAAKELGLGDARCLGIVSMDAAGVPYDVRVDDCLQEFAEPTREALMKWRWWPPQNGGTAVEAQTTIAVTYKLK